MAENGDGYPKLRRQLKEKQLSRVYIFYGEETYLREYMVGEIKKALLPEGLDGFNLFQAEGKAVTLPDLTEMVMSIPVMSEHKLVYAVDFDICKVKDGEQAEWLALLSSVPEDCSLFFVYDVIPFKPDRRTKYYAELQKRVQMVEFVFQDTSALCNWLMRRFRALQKTIDRPTCEYLIFRCGYSMTGLGAETEKIAAYAARDVITQKDIDAVVVPVLEAVSFDMTDAVAAGQTKKAAETLRKLMAMQTEPNMILGALGKTLRGLYAARLALEGRRTVRDVAGICGYRSTYPAEKLMKAAGKRTIAWCGRALEICREGDAQLKGESREKERVLEWVLANLV